LTGPAHGKSETSSQQLTTGIAPRTSGSGLLIAIGKLDMPRLCVLFLIGLACMVWHAPAKASGDFGCAPSWKLAHGNLTGCDNMAMLSPGNDTRVNLLLLLADTPGNTGALADPKRVAPDALFEWGTFATRLSPLPEKAAPDDGSYADGEGSRCLSNMSGTADFEAALAAATKLPDSERAILIGTRRGLKPDCAHDGAADKSAAKAVAQMKSAVGKAFAGYLLGAAAFYAGDYDSAAGQFAALRNSNQLWLEETARYMLARIEVNRLQVGAFDEYGALNPTAKLDPKISAGADAALQDYLKAYPRGRYFVSARGLLRRVYWLSGDRQKLAAAYSALLAQPSALRGLTDDVLAQEIDNKLLPRITADDTVDPTLLAVLDLLAMRVPDSAADKDCCGQPLTLAKLETQRHAFASSPALFDYLLAVHGLYVTRQPRDVLRLIPDHAAQGSFAYLEYSRQMLRGMALETTADRNARGFWLQMVPGARRPFQRPAIELALALHDERAHALDQIFAAQSTVQTPAIREILLTSVADAKLLRQQANDASAPAHERAVALFTLLNKDATRGFYADFGRDVALVPAGASSDPAYGLLGDNNPPLGIFTQIKTLGDYDCPALKDSEARLARNPRDGKAILCLADFMRSNGFDDFSLDTQPPKDQLGGTSSLFPGPAYSRLEAYRGIIADAKAAAPDKAYALYRAINCYAPSKINACGGPGVPVAQRKAWFQKLKSSYPQSSWAQTLEYYW
jgi:hypothetical protein